MSQASITPSESLKYLISLTTQLMEKQNHEPIENPVLTLAQKIKQQLKSGELSFDALREIIQKLRDSAFLSHAKHLQRYVNNPTKDNIDHRIKSIVEQIIQHSTKHHPAGSIESFNEFKKQVEHNHFAAVFTAHPTFALANSVYIALADLASQPITEQTQVPYFTTHRRATPPTLHEELNLAIHAIERARNALDVFNRYLFDAAQRHWPQYWTQLTPCPILLSSWVGYDTDGRTDIGWWDSLRIRLEMKELQLQRLHNQLNAIPHGTEALKTEVSKALNTVHEQLEHCPKEADPDQFSDFARLLVENKKDAILSPAQLEPLFDQALEQIDENHKIDLLIAKAGFFTHGMSLSHTHVRLNSVQVHNMARQRLGITSNPDNPSHTRTLFNTINNALGEVSPIPVDFGSLLTEKASASILMMLLTQIVKHIDNKTPIRFLIAETENGYTLLVALWLARIFGIEKHVEISPLFETDEALQHGSNIIEQALRSSHWRDYLRRTGKLCLQFGYSDSGRFIGQIAATYQIEKLRQKIAKLLQKYDLTDVEVVLFDTHGESMGRGGHPFSMEDRLQYLSPKKTELYFKQLGISTRQETAFQGGDGYLLFGSQALANATISIIAQHIFNFDTEIHDPIYDESDFSADFFLTISSEMKELVKDKGYGTLLSAFGPALIDRTGSRSSVRQSDTSSTKAYIKHPRELRAIPNNAILQQLGWCANTLQGLGTAASANPELFQEMMQNSPRFKRSLDFARHALKHSNTTVLRAIIYMLDPGIWLDRASSESNPDFQESYITLAKGLQRLNCWASTQATFHRIQTDHIALLSVWKEAPCMDANEILLHAIRLAVIEEIWMLSTHIPYFSPYHEFSKEALETKILCLEIPTALNLLLHVFPQAAEHVSDLYFYEPKGPRNEGAYAMDDRQIFKPIQKNFDLIREISVALIHRLHAFG
ncbi:phosphoenolpyruvate carboxylase [Commensalibacter oyaizuii]|uniref:Phosphoenolpyruvate carboxylase n=1 Tax=Commensalibacter oyaizuii TaxID=3043873 RepID=A0ABT6Q0Y1_9PROT|nr:phosphoenolpyruvate carboxylase [Commensalibacter sp. TBRC 16381]MDI2090401.1 phosphoenolpyruvate carboxylase [Commensalibacter sp. TBRC 16381]